MANIIFVPVCVKCGHEFRNLNVSRGFSIKCPECNTALDRIDAVDPNWCIHGMEFHYDRETVYAE